MSIAIEFLFEMLMGYDGQWRLNLSDSLQGSTRMGLGPPLWIKMCNQILTFQLSKRVNIIGFVDNIGVTVSAQIIKRGDLGN